MVAKTVGHCLRIIVGFMCCSLQNWRRRVKAFESQIMPLKTLDARHGAVGFLFFFSLGFGLFDQSFFAISPIPPFGMETFTICRCILEVYNMEF